MSVYFYFPATLATKDQDRLGISGQHNHPEVLTTMTTAIQKGGTVFRLKESTTLVVHLLSSEEENRWSNESDLRDLPGFSGDEPFVPIEEPELPLSEQVLEAIQTLQKNHVASYQLTVVRAVVLLGIKLLHETILKSKWIQRAQEQFGGQLDSDEIDQLRAWEDQKEAELAREALKNVCSPQNWTLLLACIAQHVVMVQVEHPLLQYAKQQIPLLAAEERATVAKRLGLESTASAVGISNAIQEKPLPQRYAILLDHGDSSRLPHSCLANASLLPVKNGWAVTALYNVQDPKDVNICRIEENAVEGRERQVLLLTGSSCGCLRCRYEVEDNTSQLHESLSEQDLLKLGRFFLANEQLDEASKLFEAAKSKSSDSSAFLDASHALGAIELSRNNFLKAQRIWMASRKDPKNSVRHDGLTLQWNKMDAYEYLSPKSTQDTMTSARDNSDKFSEQLYPHVFRCNMLDNHVCRQIISWAEESEWTKQRHYAVPTLDIPVHTSPRILQWFKRWFRERVCPVLSQQFHTSPNFFVHDAFVVKYEATQISNHLPIHTDESTHSFVLALNEEYKGGGTYLAEHGTVARLDTGQMLSFRGDLVPHGGEVVSEGRRYILAVFLYHDDDNMDCTDCTEINPSKESQRSNAGTHISKKRSFDHLSKSTESSFFRFGFKTEEPL